MLLREEFFPLMEDIKTSVDVMTKAANGNTCQSLCNCWLLFFYFLLLLSFLTPYFLILASSPELLDCDDLHSVIRLVLKAGNYMNAVSVLHEKNIQCILKLLIFFF